MSKLYTIIAGSIAAFLALIGLHKHGQKQGKKEQQNETRKKVIKHVETAKQKSDDVAATDIDDVRDRLRERARK